MNHTVLIIDDNLSNLGVGIEPNDYDRIFQIFQTSGAHGSRESSGVGLTGWSRKSSNRMDAKSGLIRPLEKAAHLRLPCPKLRRDTPAKTTRASQDNTRELYCVI